MERYGPKGALFSACKRYRFLLWRQWDEDLPKVLFIGLNPSVADDRSDDPTTKRIMGLSKQLGFGGCFLMNCFPHIATDPKNLEASVSKIEDPDLLPSILAVCETTVFAWGNHPMVRQQGKDRWFFERIPDAKVLGFTKKGNPRHPLYVPYNTELKSYR
ncbi:DUF1643 domain-containing protein [Flagellimonas sp. DF-77]|uniref:DUF1643 domain-containing protein n=1 Tax=Flagellimonas algarum TaxID=3230298 RepID=UPI003394C449